MLTILFFILLISFMWNMISLSIRMTWGLSKILLRIVFLPITLVFMAFSGLIQLVIAILIVGWILSLVTAA